MITLIAYLSMTVDHIGLMVMDNDIFMRVIGRAALPAFLLMLAYGWDKTRNRPNYIKRILALAIISQPICMLVRGRLELNICFILFGILILNQLIERKEYLYALLAVVSWSLVPLEYGLYGLLLGCVIMNSSLIKNQKIALVIILTSIYSVLTGDYIQMFAPVCYIVLSEIPGLLKLPAIKIPRALKYSYYPVHLIVLALVVQVLGLQY